MSDYDFICPECYERYSIHYQPQYCDEVDNHVCEHCWDEIQGERRSVEEVAS